MKLGYWKQDVSNIKNNILTYANHITYAYYTNLVTVIHKHILTQTKITMTNTLFNGGYNFQQYYS